MECLQTERAAQTHHPFLTSHLGGAPSMPHVHFANRAGFDSVPGAIGVFRAHILSSCLLWFADFIFVLYSCYGRLCLMRSLSSCQFLAVFYALRLSRIDALADGERGRLDRCRRRSDDAPAAIALGHQSVSGICRPICSARRRTERPGRSRSPFPTASFRLWRSTNSER